MYFRATPDFVVCLHDPGRIERPQWPHRKIWCFSQIFASEFEGANAGRDGAPTSSAALLSATAAASLLGITVTTLYDWLGQSDRGLLVIRGQRTTIEYFQGGPRGQGRIQIEAAELNRLRELMRVHPQRAIPRQLPVRRDCFPGIRVPLGRPGR
jgi:hypothetical protein